MVTDSDLRNRLQLILEDSDLETTTANSIRRRLEEEFAIDLYDRRIFIWEQIDLFLQGITSRHNAVEQEKEVDENSQKRCKSANEQGEEQGEEDRCKRKKSGSTDEKPDLKKKGPGGFCKPCGLSPQLQEFLGVPVLPRTQVVKKIWSYIREKNLQHPKDKRKIICDESLHRIFCVNSIDMFQMNKALSKHIWSLHKATHIKSSQKERQGKQHREVDEPKRKVKTDKEGGSRLNALLPLSDDLIKFFGTGEHELSRAQVVKRLWQYIKENELQDPSDGRMVLCDEKLKVLFKVDSFHGFGVSKLLSSHFIKTQE